jgi:DNA-binding NarL/FixJ family response regulator
VGLPVVLVEDSITQRDALERLFEELDGFALTAAFGTEAEAKNWLAEHPGAWKLAVIDLILEQGTGMGLIAKCRDRPDCAKVVVLSGYATPGIRRHCYSLGADAVFDKATEYPAFVDYCSRLSAPN